MWRFWQSPKHLMFLLANCLRVTKNSQCGHTGNKPLLNILLFIC
nr:MAG TPA: hypothetical protein [Caudoviricetes sp.]